MRSRGTRGSRDPLSRTFMLRAILAIALMTCLLIGAFGTASSQSGQGIGVAPSTLRIDDPPLVRGGTMERTLSFQQHDHDSAEVEIRVLPPSDGRADGSAWVTVEPSGTVTVPRTSDHPIDVRIEVPTTAANGEYRAKVEFRVLQACDAEGSCAAVQTAASSVLVMTVGGEQVKRLKVTGSPVVRDTEEGGALQFSLPFENVGNVVADPHVRFDVQDKHQKNVLRTYWFNATALRPGEADTKTFIRHDIDLTPDQYWADISVYLDGVLVKAANPQTFDVLEPGALAREVVLKTIRIDGALTRAAVGDLVKLDALVANTGHAPVVAVFKGQVWIDGALRDTFESDPLEIGIGETGTLTMIYTVKEAGQHEFKGKVHYGSKVTSEKTLLLRVESAAGGAGMLWAVLGGLALSVAVGVLVAVLVRERRLNSGQRRRRGQPGHGRHRERKRPPGRGAPGQGAPRPGAGPGTRGPARRGPPPKGPSSQAPPKGPPNAQPPRGGPPRPRPERRPPARDRPGR